MRRQRFAREMKQNGFLHLLTLPEILFFLVFCYVPMGGLVIAFQDYSMRYGIFGSRFNGVENFQFLFQKGDIINSYETTKAEIEKIDGAKLGLFVYIDGLRNLTPGSFVTPARRRGTSCMCRMIPRTSTRR